MRWAGALWKPFTQNGTQSQIDATQAIFHSTTGPDIDATWRYTEAGAGGTGTEFHFLVGYDGACIQTMDTDIRADAQWAGNAHGISVETASNAHATDPWTPQQLDTLVALGRWLIEAEPHIKARQCRTYTDPGFGYHRLFHEWNLNSHSCPGNARVSQFAGLLARIVAPAPPLAPPLEDDMALRPILTPYDAPGPTPDAECLVDMEARTWQWLPGAQDVAAAKAAGALVMPLSAAYVESLGPPQGPVPHL